MDELTISQATRGALSEAVAQARYAGRRTILTVRDHPAAAVVSLADLGKLENAVAEAARTPAGEAASMSSGGVPDDMAIPSATDPVGAATDTYPTSPSDDAPRAEPITSFGDGLRWGNAAGHWGAPAKVDSDNKREV